MKNNNLSHTFIICAYKESEYLEECIESLKAQTEKSLIICATSTPNAHISSICLKHDIPLHVNGESLGIAADWNFALSLAQTDLATLAHQDDIYSPAFLSETMYCIKRAKRPLIVFTDYCELKNGKTVASNRLLTIKRFMCFPFRFLQNSAFIGKTILSFGNPICCPSVTFALKNLTRPLFNNKYKTNCDWLAWLDIRNLPGEFAYCPTPLMYHRIHAESGTSLYIDDNTRSKEDLEMLAQYNRPLLARLIHRFYRKAEDSNAERG